MRGEESSDSESSRMEESSVRRSLETLCQELNMDEQTATEAMDNFTAIWNTYTLEGDVVHWLACSLYAACRKGSTPTVGKGLMEGNCVSLTRILRSSKLSLIQFFSKMRKWADMSKLSQDFRLRMERLERNFEVSTVIFRKFEPIFMDMFQNPQGTDPPRQPRSRKHSLDLVFGNALLCANRKDLINPTFRGLPAAYRADGHISSDEPPPCVLERLCELHDGLVVEAKGIKQHYFKPYIQKLCQKQILKGHDELLTELLDPQNFIDNNKAINREYEEYVLTVGDFDERVFLGADADEEIGTPRKIVQEPPASQQLQQHVEKIIHPRIREFRSGLGSARKDVPPSPLSVHDRYSSPAAGSAKRRLFGDDPPAPSPGLNAGLSPMSSPAKRLTFGTSSTLKIAGQGTQTTVLSIPLPGTNNTDRTITLIPVQACDSSAPITAQFLLTASPSRPTAVATTSDTQAGNGRPRRTGSLALFFRKVYHLASVRLRDLCVKLDISSDLRGKIWTCFEHSLVHCTDLMKDRHLDQLLLCSIYIISKITKETHTFQDIMKCYRSQPQANSHVYRSVLLRRTPREQVADENMEVDPVSGGESAEKTNQHLGDLNCSQSGGEEERGDLIQFYNTVYVLKMKSFALRYATSDNRADAPPLSPFPSVRAQPLSPRRISQRHSLYVSPHKNSAGCLTPNSYTYRINSSPSKHSLYVSPHKNSAGCLTPNSYTYRINSSPSKELSDINRMIRQGCVSRKRAFNMEGDVMMSSACDSPSKRACPENGSSPDVLLKRLQDVVSERQSH
ncbi:retinoblastoma-like protein 1 [Neolamprologus brichardi]|uniref:retinoblastoma-like protein 1 n=1 Tax=Neolamprologus brichardi TaxID=32507 RepID=UPI0016438023|nr:retinoblastoma-like protein 1 [Neolamprologus brichardi]